MGDEGKVDYGLPVGRCTRHCKIFRWEQRRSYDSIWWRNYKLHLVPSGIFYKDKLSLIGNGVVIDPLSLIELDGLLERGISVTTCAFQTVHKSFCHII